MLYMFSMSYNKIVIHKAILIKFSDYCYKKQVYFRLQYILCYYKLNIYLFNDIYYSSDWELSNTVQINIKKETWGKCDYTEGCWE